MTYVLFDDEHMDRSAHFTLEQMQILDGLVQGRRMASLSESEQQVFQRIATELAVVLVPEKAPEPKP